MNRHLIEQIQRLATGIRASIEKGHKGYTLYGLEMEIVVQAIESVIKREGVGNNAIPYDRPEDAVLRP